MACHVKILNLPQNRTGVSEVQSKLDTLRTDGELHKNQISDHFRTLHEDLNRREEILLTNIDEIIQTTSVNVTTQMENLNRYRKAKQDAEKIFEDNQMVEILRETIDKIQSQIDELLEEPVEVPEIELKWNMNEAQECVANFCEILQLNHPYSYCRATLWSSVKEGTDQENIKSPFGIAIDPETNFIFVADCNNNRIQVFTEDGDYNKTINITTVHPRSLLIHGPTCYVTCDNWVLKLNKANGVVLSSLKVNHEIRGLDLYQDHLYVCELEDYYIYVLDLNLVIVKKIKLTSEHLIEDKYGLYHAYQLDIKIVDDLFYVLFANCEYPLQSFSLSGALKETIIHQDQVQESYFFCVDKNTNFLLTDRQSHQIHVFSRSGKLLGNVSQKGTLRGQLKKPTGIALNRQNCIIVCDQKVDNILQCF
eukprot:TRINITY_DN2505_c0_g1_i1.p1 TRINITY_DN2505_c0_g1~~TRINITY_DN2505_c0_g1_i1.p1  ORF type:complete len:422 (+),score=70.69 TRINITY_DN2505_c0_g1_i1:357-1622(+)